MSDQQRDPESDALWVEFRLTKPFGEFDRMKDELYRALLGAEDRMRHDPAPEPPCCRIMKQLGEFLLIYVMGGSMVLENRFCPQCGRNLEVR